MKHSIKLNQTAKVWISIALFCVIFGTIIALASVFDYQISQLLTKNSLKPGAYLATDFFGVFGEMIGSVPVFLLIGFCIAVTFWYCEKVWKLKPIKHIAAVVLFVLGVVAFWFFFKDTSKYILEHAGNEAFKNNPAFICAMIVFALALNFSVVFATKHFSEETLKKLMKFVIAAAIGVIVANLIVAIVKDPVGRMRYRAINYAEGESIMALVSGYTPWYVFNGQPSDAIIALFPADDAFKSFPSGHTCAAGMTYALIMLPSLFKFKNKGATIACWAVPVAFTGLVAISRIVCGAHFMSDVTFGGSIAFLSMLLGREIVIEKGRNIKAMFGIKVQDEVVETSDFEGITV